MLEPMDRKRKINHGIILTATLLPFLAWISRFINADFWYDEVFTLNNYVFVPLSKTVTDYAFPNNHIFFNLINNIYLKILGIRNIYPLIDHPWIIRILPLVWTSITVLYLYRICRKFLNPFIADMTLIILVTTVPYYNFALQVRGFGLSTMLLWMMLYYLWSFERNPKLVPAILLVLFTTLALYTIPLNLYFILTIALFYFLSGIFKPAPNKNRPFIIVILICIGIATAFLLYLPVIHDVLHNRFVQSHGPLHLPTLSGTMPTALKYFISGRYLLVVIIILGLIFYKKKHADLVRKTILCAALVFVPFVLSFIRGDLPHLRVFVNLVPAFAMVSSICIYFMQSNIPRLKNMLITIIILLYCNLTFALSVNHINRHLRQDISAGRKSQDIFYNYYQAYYHPSKLLRGFTRTYRTDSIPIIAYDFDQAALPVYLQRFRIRCYGPKALEPILKSHNQAYVITAFPERFRATLLQHYPEFRCQRINGQLSFHNIFLLTR